MKILVFWFKFHWSLFLKPLSHQGGVVTATARRARKIQNAEVRAVGSPRSLRDRRGISTACRGVPKDAMPRHAFCACTKYAPWLSIPMAFWMSTMGTPWFRSGNVVTAQWGLLERHEDTVCTQRGRTWSPQEHRCRRWRLHCDLTECIETSLHLYLVLTAHLRCLHCAYIEYHLFHFALTETPQICRGDHRDPMVLPRSPWAFAGRLHGADRAITVHSQLRFTKENGKTSLFYERVVPIQNSRCW